MSATVSRPVHRPPLPTKWPALGRVKVTVRSARTAAPSTRPVSVSTPLGMSADTTGMSQVFIMWTAVRASPRTPVFRPVPKRASTITSASRHQAAKAGSSGVKGSSFPPAAASLASMARVSAVSFSREPTRMQRTSSPADRSSRAQATPSPPLLPGPQKHTARRGLSPASSRAAAARASAARSISSVEGTPRSCMVIRSSSLVWAAVAILMTFPLLFFEKSVPL